MSELDLLLSALLCCCRQFGHVFMAQLFVRSPSSSPLALVQLPPQLNLAGSEGVRVSWRAGRTNERTTVATRGASSGLRNRRKGDRDSWHRVSQSVTIHTHMVGEHKRQREEETFSKREGEGNERCVCLSVCLVQTRCPIMKGDVTDKTRRCGLALCRDPKKAASTLRRRLPSRTGIG